MVGLLVNAGMYDKALTICQLFGMKLTSVFDSLALRYVYSCVSILVQCNKIIQHLCSANYQTVEKTLFYHFIKITISFPFGLLSCVNKLKRFLAGSG